MSQQRFIPVAAPILRGKEKEYVIDCLESVWISSNGAYLDKFENAFAKFCGTHHAITCCNGTIALHLALLALGIGPGDEVIVPTLTFVATANAVAYCGARPVFVDSEPETWNINPCLIEEKLSPRTKAIIVVHLYGHPVDMDAVLSISSRHGLFVIEDAAEAHGARYKGRPVGSIGNAGTFSFYGNKIITTGEGGAVVTNDPDLVNKIRLLRGQGMDPKRRYWFPIRGYNYRMTNIEAAIGLGQLENVDWHIARRAEVACWYREFLADFPELSFQTDQSWASRVYWMFSILLADRTIADRDAVMSSLQRQGIETRPIFYPMHVLPPYKEAGSAADYPIADRISKTGMNLPTFAGLSREDVAFICKSLARCLSEKCVASS